MKQLQEGGVWNFQRRPCEDGLCEYEPRPIDLIRHGYTGAESSARGEGPVAEMEELQSLPLM